ncbi:MAG: AmmeMemoRadiSam system protein A [bacterium]
MKPQELAKLTVEMMIKEGKKPTLPIQLDDVSIDKAGTFTSIKTKNDQLRGCIGTIFPTQNSVTEEIISNSISAATKDPRFPAIQRQELADLTISVDILHAPEPVAHISELDPKVYGLILVGVSGRQGLLLPDLEGIDTAEKQMDHCRLKAGIQKNEPVKLYIFKVDRYKD